MERYIDLHAHTFYSDGIDTPEALVKTQALSGLDIIAKTDHDNFDGYYEAKQEADKWGITLIPGVEFSAGEYHILGLNFNPEDIEILEAIDQAKSLQRENARKRAVILQEYGLPISFGKILENNPRARLGKMNVLITMLRDKECRDYLRTRHSSLDLQEIRKFYLGSEGIAGGNEDMTDLETGVIINSVHNAGGIVILAHPAKDIHNIEKELGEFRELGIDGLEIQPNFYENYLHYIEYAKKHNLLMTYGSDYHGAYMGRQLLRRGINTLSPELEERLFES